MRPVYLNTDFARSVETRRAQGAGTMLDDNPATTDNPTTTDDADNGVDPSTFGDRNKQLFYKRRTLQAEIDLLEATSADPATNRQLTRARRHLERLTEKIVTTNFGLVRSYVGRFSSHTSRDDSADFEAAGLMGLMKAIDSYDPDQGTFAQWAYRPIKREVLRSVRDAEYANMNPSDFERRPEILRAAAGLAGGADSDAAPSVEEVAVAAQVTVEQVQRVLHAPTLTSLATPVGTDGGETELGELLPDPGGDLLEGVITSLSVSALEEHGLTALEPRELFVIVRRFGLDGEPPQRLSSIGDKLGLSREAARQIESKGLAKLGHPVTLRRLVRQG
jgi:RNA polymerase sigma factor (sigma-70 family)